MKAIAQFSDFKEHKKSSVIHLWIAKDMTYPVVPKLSKWMCFPRLVFKLGHMMPHNNLH